ncbi:HK97-gp10 family putative phage morphogenesis protein [Bacillus gobiensis]|uniref:HK97-gp10 family putative phage morphogenesis protein n=1 Tax=Bacillus gobiensis TaxID=1441095 RepID=UPI003D233D04
MEQIMARINQLEADAKPAIDKAARAGAEVIKEAIKENTKDSRKDEIIIEKVKDGEYKVATSKDYFEAHWEEFGTSSHIIKKKKKGILSDGENNFGKEVHHPGTTPKPFFESTYLQNIDEAQKEIKKVLKRELDL